VVRSRSLQFWKKDTSPAVQPVISQFSADEIIVIATSIPAHRPAYRRDLLNCLCYPTGTSVRFSYRKRWIETQLLERWIAEQQSSSHRSSPALPALIVFCDIPEQPDEHYSFLPLRYAHFESFEPLNILERADPDIHIAVRFKLGHFVNFAPTNPEALRKTWQAWMLSQEGKYPLPNIHSLHEPGKTTLVFTATNFTVGQEELEDVSWVRLSEQISQARTMQDCSLFRIMGVYNVTSRSEKPTKIRTQYGHSCYMLEASKSYIIRLQFYLDPGKAHLPRTLRTHASTDSLTMSEPLIKNIGLSTEAEIIVNASKVLSTEMATLVIEDTDSNTHMARAELVVLLKPERWLPLVVLFIALGTFLASASSDMVIDIATLFHAHNLLPPDATAIAYTLKGIGSALVALGAYLGFRKIPPN
jgi:hypothetical protein